MGLKLSHAFIDVADLNKVAPFYTDVLGFKITDRGQINDEIEAIFMSQDPNNHHQIALAETLQGNSHERNLGHVAFRMESLDDLLSRHYDALRARDNIILCVGGGIATPERAA